MSDAGHVTLDVGPEALSDPPLPAGHKSILVDVAASYGMEAKPFEATLRATVMPSNTSREQFAAFLIVCKRYGLNPILKEIYAFPGRDGGIVPIVSIDGWLNLINSHPQFDGMEFDDHLDADGNLTAITCRIRRKDRQGAISVTEYLAECQRGTDPWRQWPRRMLRHKATIQCARYAFSFAGVSELDEVERAFDKPATPPATPPKPRATIEEFAAATGNMPA